MRTYSVWLKDPARMVEVPADDVDLERVENAIFWNFTVGPVKEDGITVAGFPWAIVEYIVSSPEGANAVSQKLERTEGPRLHVQQ